MRLFGREWFEKNQLPLLFLANTRGGRQLLRIRDDVPSGRSIVRIEPHSYTCLDEQHPSFLHALWSMRKPREVRLISDFRCRPKFANRLGHSWVRDVAGWNQYVGDVWTRSPLRVQTAFADSLTAYPDPNPETTTVDGFVYASGAAVEWATLATGAGNFAGDSNATDWNQYIDSSTTTDRWDALFRNIMLFDASAIGDADTVDSATLSVVGTSKQDPLSIIPTTQLYASNPASNTGLVGADYSTLGSTAFSTAITYANWTTSGYIDWVLNASGLTNISKTGISKFGCRNPEYDVANVAPTWSSGVITRTAQQYAEQTGTTSDPKLVVTYTPAATSIPRYLLLLGVS